MGCDIHLHIEIKIADKWLHYSAPSVARWYALFSKMAGVRGSEETLSPPKGLPVDASEVTLFDFKLWEQDAHSISWLSAKEIERLYEWLRSKAEDEKFGFFGYLFDNDYGDFVRFPEDNPEGLQDIRFVFWFDN